MVLVAGAAYGIGISVPFLGQAAQDFIAPRAVNIGILFSMTVGFLMHKSLTRRSDIDNHIALELNKVRRMYHLARHIAKADPKADVWFRAVTGAIHEYLGLFRTITFKHYEMGSPLFRSITYAVYTLPTQTTKYDAQLYDSLLEAAGQATEAREFIRAKKDDTVSLFSWIVVTVVSLVFAVIILTATPMEPLLRLVGSLTIFCLFLVLQLIYEHDRANGRRDRAWADRYVTDLESLDHAEKMK
jgi:hypothetical protein